jgi:hypothetical protein
MDESTEETVAPRAYSLQDLRIAFMPLRARVEVTAEIVTPRRILVSSKKLDPV